MERRKWGNIFYQSEMPYDVPSQAAWMNGSVDGYASYNVAPGVANHTAYGIGVYSYFDQGVDIIANSGIAAPVSVGVIFTMLSLYFSREAVKSLTRSPRTTTRSIMRARWQTPANYQLRHYLGGTSGKLHRGSQRSWKAFGNGNVEQRHQRNLGRQHRRIVLHGEL